ncbi:MAG: LysR substrate-binding domain-containing protein, partial [Hydrogenophaga sp.]
ILDGAFGRSAVSVSPVIETTSTALMRQLAAQGVGITLLNRLDVADDVRAGRLRFVPLRDAGLRPQSLALVTRAGSALSAAAELLARAKHWLLNEGASATVKPWDAKGYKFPGGTPQSPGPTQVFFGVSGHLLGKTQALYPAPEAILAAVYDGCQVDIDTGLRIEQRQFARLATSPETKNMIRTLFYAMGDANRLAGRSKDVPPRKFGKVAVLG